MTCNCGSRCLRNLMVGLIVLAYFVAFPEDTPAVLVPIETVLRLSNSVSAGLYAVIAVAIFAGAIVRAWGRRPTAT